MLKYWLWLSTRRGIGPKGMLAVLRHFGTPEAAYFADSVEYRRIECLRRFEALEDKNLDGAEKILNTCYRLGVHILTCQDAAYPQCLKNIDDPPVLLYYQGTLPAVDTQPTVAVVGTRKASAYGLTQAKHMGFRLGHSGVIVVSGGANGIDTLALRGALSAGTPVIAVLGCGIDVVYPAANRGLFEDIKAHGCLITEYPPGTPAKGEHFPVRNRILTGLAMGVLVVEAPVRSGALNSARHALEQGRDVFALPANVGSEVSEGNLRLLKEGALLATEAWDILREYVHIYPQLAQSQPRMIPMTLTREESTLAAAAKPAASPRIAAPNPTIPEGNDKKDVDKPETSAYIDVHEILDKLSPDERAVVELLQEKPLHIDDIIDQTQLPAGRVLASITLLEVKGYLKRLPARRFSLAEK